MHEHEPGDFESAVYHIVQHGGDGLEVVALSAEGFAAVWKEGRTQTEVVVLRRGHGTFARAQAMALAVRRRPVDLVIVGGDQRICDGLAELNPKRGPAFGWTVLRDDGSLTTQNAGPAGRSLREAARAGTAHLVSREEWASFMAFAEAANAKARRKQAEIERFRARMRARKPVVTMGLMATIALAFIAQQFLGPESTPLFTRLGALLPDRAFDEPYRLLSCTLLHGGFAHAAMNTYVLFVLGSFFERIVGSSRMLILYVLSGLAGSVASALLSGATLSVGASGAVWGLLGAHAVLAFIRQDLLPEVLVAGARRVALINLAINVAASFHPLIDMWAHFGGGAAGAFVFGLILHRGLPRQRESQEARKPSIPLGVVAGLAYALMVGCLLLAVAIHRPWELKGAPVFEEVDVPELGVALLVPKGAQRIVDLPAVDFGDPRHDAMVVRVVRTAERVSSAQAAMSIRSLLGEATSDDVPSCEAAAEGGVEFIGSTRETLRGREAALCRYRYPDGPLQDVLHLVVGGRPTRVMTLRWPDFESAPVDAVLRIGETLRTVD